ncbi:uncharacterized protein BKA55DRAFT_355882 [Fusarium redolens]|uniref:Uncharacterized protein n=1 Tax=Fusarium redolens TaxID=48865 RepID=A0A9P9HAR2_FUSRE|nr:uncharacterized protein BKA55DRAFT_355882 [Fusarium redolens]KAH7254200.1 hypothetical protein BKA55DRAFT_355882 [Fusarium redolens]
MCIAHYLHYHHVPPCYRPTGLNYYYSYCAAAYYDPVTSQPLAPCGSVSTSSPGGDLNDPCTMSQCLIDPGCRSGACRLVDLNGQWKCCMCGRRGNLSYQCFNARSADSDAVDVCRCKSSSHMCEFMRLHLVASPFRFDRHVANLGDSRERHRRISAEEKIMGSRMYATFRGRLVMTEEILSPLTIYHKSTVMVESYSSAILQPKPICHTSELLTPPAWHRYS